MGEVPDFWFEELAPAAWYRKSEALDQTVRAHFSGILERLSQAPPDPKDATAWAPWWDLRLGDRIPAVRFKPTPRIDAGILEITRRVPPLLPPSMAQAYARFVRENWSFRNAVGM